MRKILNIVFVVLMTASIILFFYYRHQEALGNKIYESALNLAINSSSTPAPSTTPQPTQEIQPTQTTKKVWIPAPIEDEDPEMAEMEEIDLNALREVNPDVIGWIRIPGTKVNYPIVQSEDNETYLHYTWDMKELFAGSIFMECRNNPDFSDHNTIIYGHNMVSDSMFGQLSNYKRLSYWEKHPYVYIRTDDGVFRYEIYASYEAELNSPTYGLSFNQKQTKINFNAHSAEMNELMTGVVPQITDRFLTLSTCSSGDEVRRVVQARLKMICVETE